MNIVAPDNQWQQSRPQLRRDLLFSERTVRGKSVTVIEDSVSGNFFQIGRHEFAFLQLLDGVRSITQANQQLELVADDFEGFSEERLQELFNWLLKTNLVETTAGMHIDRVERSESAKQQQRLVKYLTPFFFRIPICYPDRWLQQTLPVCGWLFSRLGLILWMVLIAIAAYRLLDHWQHFSNASKGLFSEQSWFWLVVAGLSLKFVHECGHAFASKRMGAEVRESGIALMCLMPLAYVDVTASWRLRNRWHRIAISLGGMYFESIIAAVAVIVWSFMPGTFAGYVCYHIAFMATMTTILFNANPLMRFDGYFVLSDLLDAPNLYGRASQILRAAVAGCLFRGKSRLLVNFRSYGLLIYGLATFAYRVLICIGLILLAAYMFYGAGVIFAVAAVALWILAPMANSLKSLANKQRQMQLRSQFSWQRTCFTSLCIAATSLSAWYYLSCPAVLFAPGIVEFAPLTVVRAQSDGFIAQLPFHDGAKVAAGDVIVVLQNDELELRLQRTRLELSQAMIRKNEFARQGEFAQSQAESRNIQNLQEKIADLQRQTEGLTIRAVREGFIVNRHLQAMLGRYVESGDEILVLGLNQKELRFSVAQADVVALGDKNQIETAIQIAGHSNTKVGLHQIAPRGSVKPLHPSLCVGSGGRSAGNHVKRN
jgi:putative peptide zinc metalloprotease protein